MIIADDIHDNYVEAGFVKEPHHWKYSRAVNYSGFRGINEFDEIIGTSCKLALAWGIQKKPI